VRFLEFCTKRYSDFASKATLQTILDEQNTILSERHDLSVGPKIKPFEERIPLFRLLRRPPAVHRASCRLVSGQRRVDFSRATS
jgi:hypothetical protein